MPKICPKKKIKNFAVGTLTAAFAAVATLGIATPISLLLKSQEEYQQRYVSLSPEDASELRIDEAVKDSFQLMPFTILASLGLLHFGKRPENCSKEKPAKTQELPAPK